MGIRNSTIDRYNLAASSEIIMEPPQLIVSDTVHFKFTKKYTSVNNVKCLLKIHIHYSYCELPRINVKSVTSIKVVINCLMVRSKSRLLVTQ